MPSITTAHRANYAPFMVINPGETLQAAIDRHVRDTGHRGALIVVSWMRRPKQAVALAA